MKATKLNLMSVLFRKTTIRKLSSTLIHY